MGPLRPENRGDVFASLAAPTFFLNPGPTPCRSVLSVRFTVLLGFLLAGPFRSPTTTGLFFLGARCFSREHVDFLPDWTHLLSMGRAPFFVSGPLSFSFFLGEFRFLKGRNPSWADLSRMSLGYGVPHGLGVWFLF